MCPRSLKYRFHGCLIWAVKQACRYKPDAVAHKEVPMTPLTNIKEHSEHYFEAHPWQGTFALTFVSLTIVALISVAIMMAFSM
jgi:hypothetical protein